MKDESILAGTNTHGIFISSDRARSWYPSNKGLPKGVRITSLALYHNVLLAGTYTNGLFLSDDNGQTWNVSNTGLKNLTIRCFYTSGPILLVGTNDGIYRSTTSGKSWTPVKNGMQLNAFSTTNNKILAATNQGVLVSEDYGNSWDWAFRESAIYTLAADEKEIYLLDFFGTVYRSSTSDFQWFKYDKYLAVQSTFKLTPESSTFLVPAWKGAINNLISVQGGYQPRGLPKDTAFTVLLETPFGLLAGAVLPKNIQ